MKQHINEEQVDQLFKFDYGNEEHKYVRKFLKLGWGIDLLDERISRYNGAIYIEYWTICEHDISIGKMIEILEGFGSPIIQYIDTKGVWNMLMLYADGEFEVDIEKNELADALWEAVKYVLKEREK